MFKRLLRSFFDHALQVFIGLVDLRAQVADKTTRSFESTLNPFVFFVLLSLTVLSWYLAIFRLSGLEQLYFIAGLYYPLFLLFEISYFTFYTGSKLIFMPSPEEILDDTSILALFSACDAKSNRSLISIGLSILHCFALALYLTNKDLDLLSTFS